MRATLLAAQRPTTPVAWWRQARAVGLLGGLGLLGIWLQPIPAEVLQALPTQSGLGPWALKALLVLNPLLLLLLATAAGSAVAWRVGLGSALAGTASAQRLGTDLGAAAALGLILGGCLASLDLWLLPWLPAEWQTLIQRPPSAGLGLMTRMLYGGLSEEVMLRWGLMSLLLWAMVRVSGMPIAVAAPLAIVISAIAFGAGHLPGLALHIDPEPALIARTLLLNGLAGAVYGWLFWRVHLEAAMTCHATTHLGLFALQTLVLGQPS